jgi:uncharacterized protein (UPF0332 family)
MMDGHDFLEVAWSLLEGHREAEWRSAVSRAYYAAFHIARQFLTQCGFVVPRVDRPHAYLWLRLSNSGHPDVRNAGAKLTFLRQKRNHADYDIGRPLEQMNAIDRVQIAAEVVELLDAVTKEATVLVQIIDAMRIYERDVLGEITWQP